jgi:hypothetical protein
MNFRFAASVLQAYTAAMIVMGLMIVDGCVAELKLALNLVGCLLSQEETPSAGGNSPPTSREDIRVREFVAQF